MDRPHRLGQPVSADPTTDPGAADDAATFWGNDRLHEKLSAMGVPHTAELNARAAYEMTGPMLGFVADALAKEARRQVRRQSRPLRQALR